MQREITIAFSQAQLWMGVLQNGIERKNVGDVKSAIRRVVGEIMVIAQLVEHEH